MNKKNVQEQKYNIYKKINQKLCRTINRYLKCLETFKVISLFFIVEHKHVVLIVSSQINKWKCIIRPGSYCAIMKVKAKIHLQKWFHYYLAAPFRTTVKWQFFKPPLDGIGMQFFLLM